MPRLPTTVSTQPNGAIALSQLRGTPAVFQQTDDRQVNDAQRQQQEAVQPIKSLPFGNGNLIKDVTILVGQNTVVNHGLGRPYQGFMILNPREGSAGGVISVPTQLPALHIQLANSGVRTVSDVWVY